MLMALVCVPLVLLFGCYFLFALIEVFGPAIVALLLLLKFTLSCMIALVRYPFRPKETVSPA